MRNHILIVVCGVILVARIPPAAAQLASLGPSVRYGDRVPAEVEQSYQRGLDYLAKTQLKDGTWSSGQPGGAITGLGLMAFLAHGEDPNYGRYSQHIRQAVRSVIQAQNKTTGFIPSSMYHHGFAMLALAEAYGAVDESLVWTADEKQVGIGEALELAVRCAITSQKRNSRRAWRYSPSTDDADTSVSGAVLMGLLAARNAGLEVPDKVIDDALNYFKSCTSGSGAVSYSSGMGGFGDSMNRSAIATLVYAIGKQKGSKEFKSTLDYIANRLDHQSSSHPSYFRYYMAQALFQGNFESWKQWKEENAELIRSLQHDDGSIESSYGKAYGTSMALLSLALDYRFLPIYER